MEISGTDKTGNALSTALPLTTEPTHPADVPELAIVFNSGYLADALAALDASPDAMMRRQYKSLPDHVTIRLNGSVQAGMITADGTQSATDSEASRTLLMPIRA